MELLIIIGIGVLMSAVVSAFALMADKGITVAKENKQVSKIVSWLFLYPLFEPFSRLMDKLFVALQRSWKSFVRLFYLLLGIVVIYLLYQLITYIF